MLGRECCLTAADGRDETKSRHHRLSLAAENPNAAMSSVSPHPLTMAEAEARRAITA